MHFFFYVGPLFMWIFFIGLFLTIGKYLLVGAFYAVVLVYMVISELVKLIYYFFSKKI